MGKRQGENWNLRRAFWADRATYETTLRQNLLSLTTTRTRHVGNDPQVDRYDPDLWTDEFRFLNQPGQADIQSDLFYDYQSNVASYPKWQEWMRKTQPRLLVLWGNTNSRSTLPNLKRSAAMYRRRKCIESMAVTSRWIRQQIKLPTWLTASWWPAVRPGDASRSPGRSDYAQ